ncbi:hypothetical protein ACFTWR_16635 [Streptomyces nigra]|uniref:hypothetical protein n=1 Tax=Streptomyces nigra TaxID=1827580 RepID=UPI003626A548
MFRHDLSEFDGLLPHPDGFRSDRHDMAFSEPDWAPTSSPVVTAPPGSRSSAV